MFIHFKCQLFLCCFSCLSILSVNYFCVAFHFLENFGTFTVPKIIVTSCVCVSVSCWYCLILYTKYKIIQNRGGLVLFMFFPSKLKVFLHRSPFLNHFFTFEGWEASTKVDFIMQEKFTITPRLVQIWVLIYEKSKIKQTLGYPHLKKKPRQNKTRIVVV